MRNVDKIKDLEHELGRYRKKVADQDAQIEKLKDMVQYQTEGAQELGRLIDAILAAVASKYGVVVRDESQEVIGYRLELDDFAVDRMMDRFQVNSQKRGTQYIIGARLKISAMLKEENDNDRSDETEA